MSGIKMCILTSIPPNPNGVEILVVVCCAPVILSNVIKHEISSGSFGQMLSFAL